MTNLPNRPIPTALFDRADPLAKGLVCAATMNEPGGATRNLANAGLLVGTVTAGGLATNITGSHQPWHNRFGSGYTLALWHSGITLGIYGMLFYFSDNTLHWQRDGFNDYLRIYHNGVGQPMSDFPIDAMTAAGLLVCLWDGTQMRAYVDAVEVDNVATTTAPKTTSTTSTLTIGGSCTAYQFLAYDRALSVAEIERLYREPSAPFVEANLQPAVLGVAGRTHDLAGAAGATASPSATLRTTRRLAGAVEATSSVSGVLSLTTRVPNAVVGLNAAAVAGAKVKLAWFYSPLAQQAAPDRFGVYLAGQAEPIALIPYAGRKFYSCLTTSLPDGRYRFAVRAERAGRDQQGPASFVAHSVETRQPPSPTILAAEAIP